MATNLSDLTYVITGFDSQNNPIVTFNCDGSSQVCGSCPTDTAANTKTYLDQYVVAYVAGLQSQVPDPIASDVHALVNQPITPPAGS